VNNGPGGRAVRRNPQHGLVRRTIAFSPTATEQFCDKEHPWIDQIVVLQNKSFGCAILGDRYRGL
jgi:hypothetical protein